MKALPNLDFIRAIAVLCVVFSHVLLASNISVPGVRDIGWIGVAGVFIFFVHTSLVLMWSLERRPHTLDFYIRRVFRIYPLAILAILAAIAFHAPVGGTTDHFFRYVPPARPLALLNALLLMGNLPHSPLYLPVSVMWSLIYELQMYLTLPFLYFFVLRRFSLWPLLLGWLCIAAACHRLIPQVVAHNIVLCTLYFLPGIMAFVLFARNRPVLPAWLMPAALASALFIFMLNPGWRQGDWLCLAVGLGLPSFCQITSRWLIRASHEVATYSYSIYLMHPFALVLGIYLMPHRPLPLQLAVFAVSLTVLSIAAYHMVEKPMIQRGAQLAQRVEVWLEQLAAAITPQKPKDSAALEPSPTE
jgi:peptidoglycan/LPS O-acetylase OafA/YrhL